jgi:hypothetical protein
MVGRLWCYIPLGTFKKRSNLFTLNINIYNVLKVTSFATIISIYGENSLDVNLYICKWYLSVWKFLCYICVPNIWRTLYHITHCFLKPLSNRWNSLELNWIKYKSEERWIWVPFMFVFYSILQQAVNKLISAFCEILLSGTLWEHVSVFFLPCCFPHGLFWTFVICSACTCWYIQKPNSWLFSLTTLIPWLWKLLLINTNFIFLFSSLISNCDIRLLHVSSECLRAETLL